MSKKSRLFIILAVLAICFAFLWPSICWYYRTPKEDKALALNSLEKIRDYSISKSNEDFEKIIQAISADENAPLTEEFSEPLA